MPPKFDYEALTHHDRVQYHNELAATTLKHITANKIFSRLDYDSAANPSQRLETVHLIAADTDEDEIDLYAGIAGPTLYPAVRAELAHQRGYVALLREQMEKGVNVFNATTHQEMPDVAVYSAAWLRQLGLERWQDRNGLGISRGVTTLKAFEVMAASEIIQKIGHVFLSFPRTVTIEEIEIPESLIDTNNERMRDAVDTWLGRTIRQKIGRHEPGKSLNVALTGKTDRVDYGDDHKPERITMGSVAGGTVNLLRNGLVVPLALWNDPDDPVVEIGEPRPVKKVDDLVGIQNWQADILSQRLNIPRANITIETAA